MARPLFILNGPNLNLLGTREPDIYGSATLADIEAACAEHARMLGHTIDFRQTNHEGVLIDSVQEAGQKGAALILNPAGFGHTSVALHDALKAIAIPAIEIHLSQPAAREPFRHHSFVSSAVSGTISGFGARSYILGIEAAHALIGASGPQTNA
ncbi:MAG: type II 3-dehydroquinate dehydratase [Glycocaulis sp.]